MKTLITSLIIVIFAQVHAQVITSPEPPPPPKAVTQGESKPFNPETDIVDFPDVEAEFPGGAAAMRVYIQENVIYPEESREKGEQGRVYVTFVVERDGSVSTINIMRDGVSPALNAEAMRLVAEMPTWIPAEWNDQIVRARCRLPITFTLVGPDHEEEPAKKKGLFRRR